MAETVVPHLIGDRWVIEETPSFTLVHNPSTGEVLAKTPCPGGEIVERAAAAAQAAFPAWSRTPPAKRAAILFQFKNLLEREFEELSRLVTRENGKTLDEAKGDVRRGIEVIEFACGIPHLLKGEGLPLVAEEIDGITSREPIGVCAGITPFNFPAMVPMWMFPLAIACGNTFILKPSEKVPLTAVRLGELMLEAGLPPGVLNLVQGGSAVVDALCRHPQIAAVSFVGSSKVARHVYEAGCTAGKRVQAAGGAKNVLLVMPDAEPDSTLRAILGSAFGCAGQRCMAGSLLMATDAQFARKLSDRVGEALGGIRVGDTSSDPKAGMGPVIDPVAQARIRAAIAEGVEAGASLLRDGRPGVPERGFFVGPTLFAGVTPQMRLFREEIFGPVLSMLCPGSLAEAIDWLNENGYGNGATIFTSSGATARQFVRGIHCGMVGVNVGVPAPMALFPFAGWGNSFFGDLHVQGVEGVAFYTRQKVVLTRWDAKYERQFGW